MSINTIYVLFISLVFCPGLYGMETSSLTPIIIDQNDNQSIATILEQKPAVICIFGATPRYSAFEHYISLLKEDFAALQLAYQKNKKLKGVEHTVKQCIAAIAQKPGLNAFNESITNAQSADLMKMFFAHGIDHKILAENMQILVKSMQSLRQKNGIHDDCRELYLCHLLLPSYFADLPHLKDNVKALEEVYMFLKQAAAFYTYHYEHISTDLSLNICIMIPELTYFSSIIHQTEPLNKLETNLTVVKNEIFDKTGSFHEFVLLDQNIEDLNLMVQFLQNKGMQNVKGIRIPITNKIGFPSTIFNPYVLKAEKKHSYTTSPLFNKNLIEYMHNTKQEKCHE